MLQRLFKTGDPGGSRTRAVWRAWVGAHATAGARRRNPERSEGPPATWRPRRESNLSRLAGVSRSARDAGARRRNP